MRADRKQAATSIVGSYERVNVSTPSEGCREVPLRGQLSCFVDSASWRSESAAFGTKSIWLNLVALSTCLEVHLLLNVEEVGIRTRRHTCGGPVIITSEEVQVTYQNAIVRLPIVSGSSIARSAIEDYDDHLASPFRVNVQSTRDA